MKNSIKKTLTVASLLAFGTYAQAAALSENVVFDLADVNYIFGGLVVAGGALYAIKKAKSLIGA